MHEANFDANDFTTAGVSEADKSLLVKFFIKARPDKEATKKEGRPIYKDVEYVDIKIPGNRNGGACRPATDHDKFQRFPEHYRRFKNRIEGDETVVGTPLNEWPPMSRSMAEELRFFNVYTVEQLAGMTDNNASKFMGLMPLKEKAKLWLEKSESDKPLYEMEQKVKELQEANEALQETVKNLIARQEEPELTESQKKRRAAKTEG